ncbi:MAG: hypothetical protein AAFQ82_27455, partial [Myxococcota bacterium]
MNRILVIAAGAVATATLTIVFTAPSEATPVYSIRSANRCDTCHIEPIGWYESPDKGERACTLDCQACHTNRTGGGMRNSYGKFYGDQTLPTFSLDLRPADFANPEAYRGKNDPSTVGVYDIFDGFSGWQSGQVPIDKIEDRTGDIDPDPDWRLGFDARFLFLAPEQGDTAFFPMQLDVHGWGRITDDFNAYTTIGLQGRRSRT